MTEPRFDSDQALEFLEHLPTPGEFEKLLHKLDRKLGNNQHAVLDEDGNPQPATLLQWAHWFGTGGAQRVISRDKIIRTGPEMVPELYAVSTVFLGLNHALFWHAKPLWFETMVFGPGVMRYYELFGRWKVIRDDLWMDRCTTRAEALAMHEEGLRFARDYIAQLGTEPYKSQEDEQPEENDRDQALPGVIDTH